VQRKWLTAIEQLNIYVTIITSVASVSQRAEIKYFGLLSLSLSLSLRMASTAYNVPVQSQLYPNAGRSVAICLRKFATQHNAY